MASKRKKVKDGKSTSKRQKINFKSLPEANATLENFVIINKVPTSEKVKKIWKNLKADEQLLLADKFKQMHED